MPQAGPELPLVPFVAEDTIVLLISCVHFLSAGTVVYIFLICESNYIDITSLGCSMLRWMVQGTGEMVQLVKSLLFKNEDLSSNPLHSWVVLSACDPSKEEVETGRSLVLQGS